MPVPFLDLRAQYKTIKSEIDPAIQAVIDSCAFALGPAVDAFEKAFAAYCGVKHCIGVSDGTAAIELILRAYGIGPGNEVITVANSFFASAEAISLAGATPVLVDCNEDDALIDVTRIGQAITPKTRAIIPVHLYGQCADMDVVNVIAKQHNLIVIEDACQAHGSGYKTSNSSASLPLKGERLSEGAMRQEFLSETTGEKSKKAGSLGHAAAFSFYPGKNLGAYGEGGGVTTNDDAIAAKVRMLRDHGMAEKYKHSVVGKNDRLDSIQGAVLGVKLKHLDAWNEKRRAHAKLYRELLANNPAVRMFTSHPDREHNYHLFVVRVANRDQVQAKLKDAGISTGIHYPIPIHLQEAYAGRWKKGDFPVAERMAGELLSLPMFAELDAEMTEEVCRNLTKAS